MSNLNMRERVAAQVQHALFRWSTNKACGRGGPYAVADAILPLIEEAMTAERERAARVVLDQAEVDAPSNRGLYVVLATVIRGGESE